MFPGHNVFTLQIKGTQISVNRSFILKTISDFHLTKTQCYANRAVYCNVIGKTVVILIVLLLISNVSFRWTQGIAFHGFTGNARLKSNYPKVMTNLLLLMMSVFSYFRLLKSSLIVGFWSVNILGAQIL